MDVVKPKALKRGDTVAIVAPSGPVEQESLERGVRVFEELGLKVQFGDSVLQRWGYLAGKDNERALDLMRAWSDPDVKAVIAARGGYGAMRILPLLDFDCIRAHPKILMGYSDITALHLAFLKEANLCTFHGPMAELWAPKMQEYNLACVRDVLFGMRPLKDLPLPTCGSEDAVQERRPLTVLEKGRASGRLVGGNLSLVASTIGTPWEIQTKGCILFLEDIGEKPYRIDRMLCQLKLSGKLDDAEGFCLGDFTDCEPDPQPQGPSFSVEEVLRQYFSETGKPCLANVPCGHGKYNGVLPLGLRVEITADLGKKDYSRLVFLEQPVI